MRRYLLVLVTIAVVLSLALVGCVGTQPPSGGGETPEPTPTTPPSFEPKPTDKFILLGSKVKFDWTGWQAVAPKDFIPQGFNFYIVSAGDAANCCTTQPTSWGTPVSVNVCCPYYETEVASCGCYWWKVEACGLIGQEATTVTIVSPRSFCVVPAFEVSITGIATAVVKPGQESASIQLDVCKLTDPASIVIRAMKYDPAQKKLVVADTLCATTSYLVKLTTAATPFFDLNTTDEASGVLKPATTTTVTLDASDVVCTGLCGQKIADVTLDVYPAIETGPCCPPSQHCCNIKYTVDISLSDCEVEAQLWSASACPQCASPTCDCGWFVLKVPTCLASITDLGTITIYKAGPGANEYTEMYTILPEDESDFKVLPVVSTGYKYLGICLTDAATHTGFATALELGATYYVDMKKGAFKLNNGKGVTFGWPCTDWDKTPLQAK